MSPPIAQKTDTQEPEVTSQQEIMGPSIVSTNYQIMIEPIRILEDESLESALGILSSQIREQGILNDPFDNSVLSSHNDLSKSQPPASTHEQGKFESGMGLLTDTGETPENKVLHPQAMQVQPQPIKKKRVK